jgi:microcompartment protein CcmL/EutN
MNNFRRLSMANAVGMIEVFGLVSAFVAGDAGCKAANVTLEPFDRNKPANADSLPVPLIVMVKFRGSIEDVKAAVEAAEEAANKVSGVISKHVIARPENGTEKMLKLNGLDKN